ncbi:MAG TPA: hypothetical protein ENK11_07635, partial [Phycisphaerales bacterium]|nr:hypothetical protein [Phycisphaerales bacterium]
MNARTALATLALLALAGSATAHDQPRTCAPTAWYPHPYTHDDIRRHHGFDRSGFWYGHDRYPARGSRSGLSIHIGTGRSSSFYSHSRHDVFGDDWYGWGRHGYSRWYGWPDYSRTTRVPRVIVERPYEHRAT